MPENPESDAVTESESTVLTGPKMWTAVLIVVVNLTVIFSFLSLASTNIENIIGLGLVPLASTFLLVIWWMRSEGVPVRDRRIGIILFFVIVGGITGLHGVNGIYLLIVALPILTTLIVLKLLLTFNKPWRTRRRFVAFVMALWTIIFALLRVDNVGGDMIPLMAWRWSPPMAHEFAGVITIASQPPVEPISLPAELAPEDWPGFRGSDRDGRAMVATFGTDWDTNAPKELWRRSVGLGWSSFTVVGDYIFTQEQRGDGEFVVCYHAETGDEVWTNYIPARFDDATGSGPRATPTYADGKLYVQGATGVIQCLDASTGA
ncbi:MAG: PQQ-binding-like beta-propeller repeat protein, partial [Candidatus Hydrogenedentota bacterium]